MKKTNILRLIALIMCIPFAFSLVSCGDTEKQTTATTAPAPNPVAYSKIGFHNSTTPQKPSAEQIEAKIKVTNDEELLNEWNKFFNNAKKVDSLYDSGALFPFKTYGYMDFLIWADDCSQTEVEAILKEAGIVQYQLEKFTSYESRVCAEIKVKHEDINPDIIKALTRYDEIQEIIGFLSGVSLGFG